MKCPLVLRLFPRRGLGTPIAFRIARSDFVDSLSIPARVSRRRTRACKKPRYETFFFRLRVAISLLLSTATLLRLALKRRFTLLLRKKRGCRFSLSFLGHLEFSSAVWNLT